MWNFSHQVCFYKSHLLCRKWQMPLSGQVLCVRNGYKRNAYTRTKVCKKPFINPSQGKIVCMCISTLTPPRNNYIWSLQSIVLLWITSSAYHFHAYYIHVTPCLTPSKVQDIKEIGDPDFHLDHSLRIYFYC